MRTRKHVLVSEGIVIATFVVMVVVSFAQVICRYLLAWPLPWADELARICLVWMVFAGMVSALVRGQQVTVNLLLDRYRGRVQLVAAILIDLAMAVLFAALLYGGVLLVQLTSAQTTPGLGLPKSFVYAAMPVGSVLMLIELARRIVARLQGREIGAPAGGDVPSSAGP